MTSPRQLIDPDSRDRARRIRDGQWQFAERVARHGVVWFCVWDQSRRHPHPTPDDVEACGLIDGLELLEWLESHADWWEIGDWSDERYARPVRLTEAGCAALANRHLYDLEPVTGGLVEPGWQAVPAEVSP